MNFATMTAQQLIEIVDAYNSALTANHNTGWRDPSGAAATAAEAFIFGCPCNNTDDFSDEPRIFTLPNGERLQYVSRHPFTGFSIV